MYIEYIFIYFLCLHNFCRCGSKGVYQSGKGVLFIELERFLFILFVCLPPRLNIYKHWKESLLLLFFRDVFTHYLSWLESNWKKHSWSLWCLYTLLPWLKNCPECVQNVNKSDLIIRRSLCSFFVFLRNYTE